MSGLRPGRLNSPRTASTSSNIQSILRRVSRGRRSIGESTLVKSKAQRAKESAGCVFPFAALPDPSPCPGRGQARVARAGEGSIHPVAYLNSEGSSQTRSSPIFDMGEDTGGGAE